MRSNTSSTKIWSISLLPLRAHRLFVSVSAYPCRWPRIPRQLSTAHPAQNAGGSIDVQNFRFTCVLPRKRSQNAKQGLMEWVGQRIIHDWDCIPISIPKARRAVASQVWMEPGHIVCRRGRQFCFTLRIMPFSSWVSRPMPV